MDIRIKTLTPIWTGDVDGKCSKIKETGIIGSLRWWYEALVRGYGGYACDPSSDENGFKKCELKEEKFNKALKSGESAQEALDAQICPACQLFGCTGWSRRFRLEITNNVHENFDKNKGFEGNFDINIIELHSVDESQLLLLWQTFYIIGKYGTIGAKNMLKPSKTCKYYDDMGQVEVIWEKSIFGKPNLEKQSVEKIIGENKKRINKENNSEWPNLKYFLFSPDESLSAEKFVELQNMNPYSKFIKGDMHASPPRANKFASFKNGKRFWGYTKEDHEMYKKVSEKLKDLGLKNIIIGKEVIKNEL
ncbi:MAG: type III-B CRISPR module RAMP protein Cmr1 [Candidatus Altiarchaeales archaeon HGW-Altiarchaeales-3]|nr:MAG: type III-B CRISPR module RAMP protein Cmr1 [Candidatus Altiarchaeales archaeon HGW-Altiarchaeales-3]